MTSKLPPRDLPQLGLGIGWRPDLAWMIQQRQDLGFVELIAEHPMQTRQIPAPVHVLQDRGVTVIPHGLSLSLGSAELPDRDHLKALARLATELKAPLISEHLAFVRAGGLESGHLLPVPRTREALDIVVRNVRAAQAMLPVPLALENIASIFEWPEAEMTEADFLAEVADQTGCWILLDVENLYAHHLNHGTDPQAFLDRLPLEQIAYVHAAGGWTGEDGLYHDTHAHAVPQAVLDLFENLCQRIQVPGVMLERDDRFPSDAAIHAELDALQQALHGATPGSRVASGWEAGHVTG